MGARRADIVVVGAGIAGLAAAWHLARSGAREVLVVEREALPFVHASGRNAAIYRTLETTASSLKGALALRTGALLDGLFGGDRSRWLVPTGLVLLSAEGEGPLEPLARAAAELGVAAERLAPGAAARLCPVLEGGSPHEALFAPGDGVIDTHAVQLALRSRAHAAGVRFRFGATVEAIRTSASGVEAVTLTTGEDLGCRAVVAAPGAWLSDVAMASGSGLRAWPVRRHLAMLDVRARGAVAWRLGDEVYLRPESGGLLASPCDEQAWLAGEPPVDAEAVARLGPKLATLAPAAAKSGVRRAWACLRTFATDRLPLAGADPQHRGLFWLGGLGGYGMSCGLAVGEVVADAVLGRRHPLGQALAPGRGR